MLMKCNRYHLNMTMNHLRQVIPIDTYTLENTEGAIENVQSRETSNIWHTAQHNIWPTPLYASNCQWSTSLQAKQCLRFQIQKHMCAIQRICLWGLEGKRFQIVKANYCCLFFKRLCIMMKLNIPCRIWGLCLVGRLLLSIEYHLYIHNI
jgi:hypothetical protein